jgi:hypothetical protein
MEFFGGALRYPMMTAFLLDELHGGGLEEHKKGLRQRAVDRCIRRRSSSSSQGSLQVTDILFLDCQADWYFYTIEELQTKKKKKKKIC